MPASQAKTIFSMGPVWLESSAATPAAPAAPPPVRAPETEDFLPFICSIFAVAEVMSPSSCLPIRRNSVERAKLTAAAAATAREMHTYVRRAAFLTLDMYHHDIRRHEW